MKFQKMSLKRFYRHIYHLTVLRLKRELFITVMTKLLDTDREDCMIVNFHMSHIRKLSHMKNCTMEH